jgi:two-component system KDP operon response regulator KdpE
MGGNMLEKKNTILIVDDEPQIRKMLGIFLEASDFKIAECDSAKQAMRLVASIKPELILLDLGLPDMDGKEVIAAIREWSHVPIVVISVRDDDKEVAAALNAGADDYVTKPFNPDVLLARVNANLRKSAVRETGQPELSNGHVRIDLVRHEVFVNNQVTSFTPKEYELLRYFMVNHGKMLTHRQILKEVWGAAHSEDMQYLRVYVGQVRGKIEIDSTAPKLIVTEPGIGYRMETIDVPLPAEAA